MNDEAVSPVISTILMVAIVVVLSATVFALVNGKGTESAVVHFPNLDVVGVVAPTDGPDGDLFRVEHRGGECIEIDEIRFTIRLADGADVQMVADDADGLLCVGDMMHLDEPLGGGIPASESGKFVRLQVIRGDANAILFEEQVQLA